MFKRDYRDIIGGLIIVTFGAFVVVYGLMTMSVGTPQRMGPGFFPISVGFILTLLGTGIFVPALFRPGILDYIDWRPLLAITASLIAFGLTIPLFGLVPAIAVLVAISTLAQGKINAVSIVLTAGCLSLISYSVFNIGLSLALPMARWPF